MDLCLDLNVTSAALSTFRLSVSPYVFRILCIEGDGGLARSKAGRDIPNKRTARIGYDRKEVEGSGGIVCRERGFPGGIQFCGGDIRAAHALDDRGTALRRMASG